MEKSCCVREEQMMKELPKVPGTKVLCPEECRYRNKVVPFCGYCLPAVMKKLGMEKGKENSYGREENKRDRTR